VHQQEALDALRVAVGQGRDRAWVVLPPGAGKTLVGLETVRRLGRRAVVFGPNTAIQSQWLAGWAEFLPTPDHPAWSGDGRDLSSFVTALTYQSLATFDPDSEVDEEGAEQPLLTRLHPNGLALVEAMRAAGPLTLVLDECHHLLQVWGRLLAEVLDQLPDAFVLGLTATPAESLTGDEAGLVDALFGEPVYRTSIPAVVREGDLAPFAELAWLTTPTPTEQAWVSDQANRFGKLVHDLTDPSFGSIGFFEWLDRRFVVPVGADVSWHELAAAEPELCTAALRMHRAGHLALPDGARLTEQHRHEPTADDWVLLVDDWMRRHLTQSTCPDDQEVVAAVRRVLPSVGYRWTRHGIRKGRSPVDRVLARSAAKTDAVPTIVAAEHRAIGDRLRMLVLCDHERATATLPADLDGVLAPQAGAALLVLDRLLVDPQTRDLEPMLVSGSTVAGSPETLAALVEQVRRDDPRLADQLGVVPGNDAAATLEGPWTSRRWVGLVTRFFEAGAARCWSHSRAARRGVGRKGGHGTCRPHRGDHPHRRRPDPRPDAAGRPGMAGQGRAGVDRHLPERGPPKGRQRLAAVRTQAHRLLRRGRGRLDRRRGGPHRPAVLAVLPAAAGRHARDERADAGASRAARRHRGAVAGG